MSQFYSVLFWENSRVQDKYFSVGKKDEEASVTFRQFSNGQGSVGRRQKRGNVLRADSLCFPKLQEDEKKKKAPVSLLLLLLPLSCWNNTFEKTNSRRIHFIPLRPPPFPLFCKHHFYDPFLPQTADDYKTKLFFPNIKRPMLFSLNSQKK